MQHLPIIKIPTKKHVGQYIKSVYLCEDAIIRIPHDDLILMLIVACCTHNVKDRYTHDDKLAELEMVDILLPPKYQDLWLKQSMAKSVVKFLEKYFWQNAEVFIYRILNDQHKISFKEDAIREFYEAHYLNESIYPVGHFRRQLERLKIKGTRAELPAIEKKISYKLTHQQCMQVWRLNTQRKISLRIIANHYQISHEGARKIIKNISQAIVLKVDKKLTV